MPAGKHLFILRHTKSSWDDPVLDDHERPLAARGRKAAKLLAEHVRATGIEPALILCSSARRTRETLESVLPGREALIEDELYEANCEALIVRLHSISDEYSSAMLVGHNPAVQMLVLKLAGATGDDQLARSADPRLGDVQRKFPTGGLATLTFDCDWAQLAPGSAQLIGYVRPRALV